MAIELPWIEKYRPERLEQVVGQKEAVERLKSYVKQIRAIQKVGKKKV